MNKNIENYKKAVDQIHVDERLKDKVLEQTKSKEKNKSKQIKFLRYATGIAAVAVVAVVGITFMNKPKEEVLEPKDITFKVPEDEKIAALDNVSIKRFESVEELREVLKEHEQDIGYNNYGLKEDVVLNATAEESASKRGISDYKNDTTQSDSTENIDYSKTNNQVENVDEADFVKTDGNYIYYSKNNRVYIVDKDLNLKATIKDEDYIPTNIFINKNKLIVFGNSYANRTVYVDTARTEENSIISEDVESFSKPKTYARVYNLDNIEDPKLVREITIDGHYQDARMIENNVYFTTSYSLYFSRELEQVKDEEILPSYRDSNISSDVKCIEANRIARFDNIQSADYSLIAGFNLDINEEVNVETFFGFGENMYVSEKNMYIICTNYGLWNENSTETTTIYKFKLENSTILAQSTCKLEGYTNNQFSLDEYNGNLRVATTISKYDETLKEVKERVQLSIFNENLEKIGGIDNLIEDEKIYAVRFIGNIGYIVTFEQVDPLWVIDLSDPTNPVIKGELEIPGYSSYLHPYDETHVIGIGYDVKDNGYGGVTNDKIKLSMFDVSDLENPKEIFKINFNNSKVYTNIMHEHKGLFFNKDKNLIGIPINVWQYGENNKSGYLVYKIDLENNKFEEVSEMISENRYSAERALYIGEYMYIFRINKIEKIDLNTFENVGKLELETEYDDWLYR